jgi:alpha-L-rhamnosidase
MKRMKTLLIVTIFIPGIFTGYVSNAATSIEVGGLTCEHFTNPVGIGTVAPRLSWVLSSGERDQAQTAYQILVASTPKWLTEKKADYWNSGKVALDQSILIEYAGGELGSRDVCWWKVRVWDRDGKVSAWSAPASFEIGLLASDDWKADWIRSSIRFTEIFHPSPMLRKEFSLSKKVASARLYITSLGLYQAEINGKKVGDLVLTPGWTSYQHRVQYQTYDVGAMLNTGGNALGVILGDGWYRAFRPNNRDRENFGKKSLDVIAQLEVTYDDGTTETIHTDDSWKSATGPIRKSSIYNGETYDARLEKPGWSKSGFDDSGWSGCQKVVHDKDLIVYPPAPPMRKQDELVPIEIMVTPEGDTVVDMGQNMVGWIRLKVDCPEGTAITLRHAEVLDKEGNFYTANLRRAKQTNTYICKGGGTEIFEPHFTFQGFRFVDISGCPVEVTKDMLTGIVVHSDLARTGTFSCNDSLINQLQHNVVWGQKGNFVGVPTDCPQRDERLGWTGDCQAFAPTACYNMDCSGFYTKWLRDLAADQHKDGAVPHVIPNVLGRGGAHGWQDAAVIVPWTVYQWYGDVCILKEQYESMKALVGFMRRQAGDAYIWVPTERQFGDWLAYATTRSDYPGATTDKDLLATCYFYHSTDLLRKTAEILGKDEDARDYGRLLAKIKSAFAREYITPNGRMVSNTQTAYVVALSFGLIPGEMEGVAAKRLADDVDAFGHLTTGFLGTPDLCHVLTRYGYLNEAYMLLYRTDYPSWLYPVTQGATTIWERWDGLKPDSTFQDPGMNSFNHYAYGAVGDWLYRKVAGIDIDPASPGFKSIIIKPHPGGEMNDVKASHQSPYGKVSSGWEIGDGKFILTVNIPVNTRATIYIPSTSGTLEVNGENAESVERVAAEVNDYHYLKVSKGSGRYVFMSTYDQ